jgi:hypothetical protein
MKAPISTSSSRCGRIVGVDERELVGEGEVSWGEDECDVTELDSIGELMAEEDIPYAASSTKSGPREG